jgi:hypothetical protein
MKVEGLGAGKDFKLYPGGGRAWDWAETGTRHSPGVQPADVEELMAHGATIVVLSQSMNKQLHVHPDTYRYLEDGSSRSRLPRPGKRSRSTTTWPRARWLPASSTPRADFPPAFAHAVSGTHEVHHCQEGVRIWPGG